MTSKTIKFSLIPKRFIFISIYAYSYNSFRNAAVTTSSNVTADFGKFILEQGGSVADCAIAVLLSSGVRNPERMGLGGGFILSYYNNKTKDVDVLLAREQAPLASTPNMFSNVSKSSLNQHPSVFGGLSVCVPGTLKGYWELHKKYGRLPWKFLVEPAIKLCKNGVLVEAFTRYGLKEIENNILHSKSLRHILIDPFTGKVKQERQKIYRHTLGKTLELIAEHGPDVLYNGHLTESFVKDIRSEGGIITEKDMNNYRPIWLKPIKLHVNDLIFHCPPPPSSGVILLCILNAISTLGEKFLKASNIERWFQIIEVWKHAYGLRSNLGDPAFVKNIPSIVKRIVSNETAKNICSKITNVTLNDVNYYGGNFDDVPHDKGTSHFNFVSPNGDAISVTESINALFGAVFRSESTGIILNNSMNDFSVPNIASIHSMPPFSANLITPGKAPLSSMTPTIVTDKNYNLRLLIGGSGGTRIITAISLVLIHYFFRGLSINKAVDMVRLHHQLLPMEISYEYDFPQKDLHALESKGHKVSQAKFFSTVGVILKDPNDGLLHAKGDLRRRCANCGF